MKRALNCWPWVRSLTHSPDAVIHSPGETMAAWPTTVIRSRCPRAFVLRTQKPFSGLWKVTRSTSPARTSRSELSACRPAPGFTASWGPERSAQPSPAVPDRPPRQDPETCPERHRQLPTRQLRAAPSGPHAGPSPSSTTSPYDKVPVPSIYSIVPPNDGSALRHGHHFEPVDFVIDHGRGHHDAYSAGSCQRTYARACECQ